MIMMIISNCRAGLGALPRAAAVVLEPILMIIIKINNNNTNTHDRYSNTNTNTNTTNNNDNNNNNIINDGSSNNTNH